MAKVVHLKPIYFRTFAAIQDYHKLHKGYPNVRELRDILNLSSTSLVEYRIRMLERKGAIKVVPYASRAMSITCDIIVLDIDWHN